MFNWLKKLFKKENNKTVSTTVTSEPLEVSNPYLSETDIVVEKAKKMQDITLREINILLAERLDTQSLGSNLVKFQESILKDAVFIIESATVRLDKDKNPVEVLFVLKDLTYNLNISITASNRDFHDIFKPFHMTPIETTGENP